MFLSHMIANDNPPELPNETLFFLLFLSRGIVRCSYLSHPLRESLKEKAFLLQVKSDSNTKLYNIPFCETPLVCVFLLPAAPLIAVRRAPVGHGQEGAGAAQR